MFVLLDSNVWLAALARDGYCRRVVEACTPLCTLVTTPFVCAEVREKLVAKFSRTPAEAGQLVAALAAKTLFRDDAAAMPREQFDPDDQPIVAAAVAYDCRFLVTGDKELLELKTFAGVEIISVREFAGRLGLKPD